MPEISRQFFSKIDRAVLPPCAAETDGKMGELAHPVILDSQFHNRFHMLEKNRHAAFLLQIGHHFRRLSGLVPEAGFPTGIGKGEQIRRWLPSQAAGLQL